MSFSIAIALHPGMTRRCGTRPYRLAAPQLESAHRWTGPVRHRAIARLESLSPKPQT